MEKFYQLKQELLVMKTNNIKPNYSELARIHKCDRRTVKKYDNGYEGKPINRNKESKLNKYKEEISYPYLVQLLREHINISRTKTKVLVIIPIFINIQLEKKLSLKKRINFILDMKQSQVNNYNLIGRRTLKCTINMVKYSNLIYFLQH